MISSEEFERTIPVSPPMVNRNRNPITQIIGGSIVNIDLLIVAIHLNTLIPVGIAITMVAAVKYARVSTSSPTVNIW